MLVFGKREESEYLPMESPETKVVILSCTKDLNVVPSIVPVKFEPTVGKGGLSSQTFFLVFVHSVSMTNDM